MIEDRGFTRDLGVERPVSSLHAVSHDPTLRQLVTLRDGRRVTAVQLQWMFLEQVHAFVADRYGSDARPRRPRRCSTAGRACCPGWSTTRCVVRAASWTGWPSCGCWRASGERERLAWDAARLQLIDLQWADVRPEKGLYHRLVERGQVERLVTDEEIDRGRAASRREDTRAYFRGRCLARYGEHVAAASWDSVIFDIPGRGALQRVPTLDPHARHPRARRGRCSSAAATAADLVDALAAQ